MAWLDEKNKFTSQTNLGWTFAFEANGKYPMIANRIFATKAGAEAFIDDTTANATAIPGLILRVIEDTAANNGAYLVEKNGETGLKLTRIVTGTLDISGEMIDVIRYDGGASHEAGFYNKADGSGEPWVPSESAQPIKDDLVDSEGKYLCLVLNDADWVYIKSTNLIDLTDYYTKGQVDEKIDALDSSISGALDVIKEYVNTYDDILDEKISALDSSLKNYVDTENNKINQHLDKVDASITNIANEITDFVNTVEDQFIKIDTSLNNLTDDLDGVHESLDDINTRHETDIERIDEYLNNIDASIEELKSVDASLDKKIDDVSERLAELEIGTVDSISTEGKYIHVDTSKGDVTFTADVVDSNDQIAFPSRGLVTDGYVEERLDVFNWVEVD